MLSAGPALSMAGAVVSAPGVIGMSDVAAATSRVDCALRLACLGGACGMCMA